jgi:fucose permease
MLWVISLGFIFVPFSANPKEEEQKPPPDRFYNTTSLQPNLERCPSAEGLQQQQSDPQDQLVRSESNSESEFELDPPHYYAELVVGTAAFLVNGVNLIITSYLSSYADETGVESTTTAEYQIMVFWLFLTLGRVVGTIDQFYNVTDDNIVPRTDLWILSAVGSAFLWLILWNFEFGVWGAVILLGFLAGPVVGYMFDWTHRITIPSEASTTILLLLTFVGGHMVVYICAAVWDAGAGPRSMIVTIIAVFFLAIPFMSWGRKVSYLSKFNYRAKPLYHRLSSNDLVGQDNRHHH